MEELLTMHTKDIGMDWAEFTQKAPFDYMPEEDWRQYNVYRQIDPKTAKPKGFRTPSKKAELYLESMITLGRTGKPFSNCELPPASKDYDPLPYYMEPSESPIEGTLGKDFPLIMTNGRLPYTHHGTLFNVPWIREMNPVAEVWVHPDDSKKYDIPDNQWGWIESLRGKIRALARVTESIRPGVVYMERFWNPETMDTETKGFKEMNVNILTKSSGPYNDVVGTYTLRGILVKLYKAEGPPEGIWQKPEDFKPWLPQSSNTTQEVEK
jgi:anaerobic selenocysteine-containing dehydrogenase